MKSLIALCWEVLSDLENQCGVSTTLDRKTIERRYEHEGISFLTISLPAFCSDFEKSLDEGQVAHDRFLGFARNGGLPRFLGGFLAHVFDRRSGRLLDEPMVEAIHAIRQLTLMFGKIRLECSPERTKRAFSRFVECEQEVKRSDHLTSREAMNAFSRMSLLLWAPTLDSVEKQISQFAGVPKHGPGATADRLRGNAKYCQRTWPRRLEAMFPSSDFLIPNSRYFAELDRVELLEPGAEMPVRVITVPKTLKTPRLIAIEPTAMQYAQQGLLEIFMDAIGHDDIMSRIVEFRDQSLNRDLARTASLTGKWATLDLSEASDRVSNQHVRALLAQHQETFLAVDACRSRKADVLGHGVIRLAKFASMGSALCFPMEMMVFATVVFMGIEKALSRPLTRKDVKSLRDQVRIYGDDIIVPIDMAPAVVESLESFGFRVNSNKSFWTGKFRESCGGEYYDGHDVTIVRVRSVLPSQRRHAREIVATVSLRNQLYKAGLWNSARHLDNILSRVIPYPVVEETSPVLGRHSFLGHESQRMCASLHRPLVRGMVEKPQLPISRLDGEAALLKYFLKRGDKPLEGEHLERAGRPRSVSIVTRWAPAV